MPKVDVTVSTIIDRPREIVAAYAADPGNAPIWYVNIEKAEWLTDDGLRIGARIAFVAHFLFRELSYVYEVIDYEPGRRIVMASDQGALQMETTYIWDDAPGAATAMTLRNRGDIGGFMGLFSSLMRSAMRRATTKDLAKLKAILEEAAAA